MANNEPLKYNFVFFFAQSDFWEAILGRELYRHPQVRVYKQAFDDNKLLQKLFHFHWAYSLNCKINMPFKRIWFKKMYEQHFDNDLPLCFVYMGGNSIRYDGGFCDYVRKRNPKNKQVILHQDLISKKCNYDYSIIRNKVDLAVTYDKGEAEQYGIEYIRELFYSKLVPEVDNNRLENDVYFLGAAKDRLDKIEDVYNRLKSFGLKCKFQITNVPLEKRNDSLGIEYLEKPISYKESLENIVRSKCLLEITQGASVDLTTRAVEAIAYRRWLLTDCQLCGNDIFNNEQVLVFKEPKDINESFFSRKFNADDNEPVVDYNPILRLYRIQDVLDKK